MHGSTLSYHSVPHGTLPLSRAHGALLTRCSGAVSGNFRLAPRRSQLYGALFQTFCRPAFPSKHSIFNHYIAQSQAFVKNKSCPPFSRKVVISRKIENSRRFGKKLYISYRKHLFFPKRSSLLEIKSFRYDSFSDKSSFLFVISIWASSQSMKEAHSSML